MSKERIAVPSMVPGGLKAQRSGHFGRCDVFTIIDIEDGKTCEVGVVQNIEHSEGGCLAPVNLLAGNRVDKIVVGGMGMRPLMGFRAAGIEVLLGEGETVQESVDGYLGGRLHPMSDDHVCGGH